MLIGVSGSHCTGKSTLIDAFCERHPEFTRLAEPYEELDELWSEVTVDVLLEQLELQVEQLRTIGEGNVIIERTPLDFVAYLQALNDLGRSSFNIKKSRTSALEATANFDLIVFVTTEGSSIYVPEEEDRELRDGVNTRLQEVLSNMGEGLTTLEVSGSDSQRVETLEAALATFTLTTQT